MKHRSKKKSHAHGKHHKKSRHHAGHDGEPTNTSSSPSPRASKASTSHPTAPANADSRRTSTCEYCGAASSNGDGYDDDMFDCADDCDRPGRLDINSVTCPNAYHLRSPHLTAFFCECGLVLSEIHSFFRLGGTASDMRAAFTESSVLKIRPKLLALFAGMWRLGVGHGATVSVSTPSAPPSTAPTFEHEDDGDDGSEAVHDGPTCPFVMVLSVLLPALHKFLQFAQLTKPHWWLATNASFTATAALDLLATQLQFHDLLAALIAEGDRIAQLIEENEERDQDISRLMQQQRLTPRRSGGYSSSSSSSSLTSSNSRPGSANDRDGNAARLPQIRKISFEWEEWLAECKFELAELSEAMQENVEITALRISRFPPLGVPAEGPPKAKGAATEFVESVMKQLLVPLGERVVRAPSPSRSYVFPRMVDRCIGVAIDEYVVENGKWTAPNASQFEKAIEIFRSWGLGVDAEYDKQLINAPRDVARLGLLSMDAFRRLDILLQSWLRNGKDGEAYVPRLTFKTNLENLRSTLKKTMTARGGAALGGGGSHSALSGIATPPPVQE